jgi:hypothetical protein
MSATIDLVRGSPGAIIVSGRGSKGYRVYLHKARTGEQLGSGVVDSAGKYDFVTYELVIQNFQGQTIEVCVRETPDNETFSDWSISKQLYIFPSTGIHDA